MARNKKIIILGIGILLIILLPLVFTTDLKYYLCSGHYMVECWQVLKNQEPGSLTIVKEHILCSDNKDCSFEKMEDFCSPGHPNLLRCADAKYYCGDDGYCKGCVCPWFSPTHWLSVD
jgi:hypothetical protein